MSTIDFLKPIYLARFSKPVADRPIYRALSKQVCASIVEIGVGQAVRTQRILRLLRYYRPHSRICYTGIDLFEARPESCPGLSLKQSYQLLASDGVQVRLIPGDPLSALGRTANSLQGTDVLIISADQDGAALQQAWSFVPRMLHNDSIIFLEQPQGDETRFTQLGYADILAFAGKLRHRAA
jgi:hypothetical protein